MVKSKKKFLLPCDCGDHYIQKVMRFLTELQPIIRRMGLKKSGFQILLFKNPEKLPVYADQLRLRSAQVRQLLDRVQEGYSAFNFETVIALRELPEEPVTAGVLLEELSHLKLRKARHPSCFHFPDQYKREGLFKMETVSAIGHYFTFKVGRDCGGSDYLKQRNFCAEFLDDLRHTQSLKPLESPELYSQTWLIAISDLLGIFEPTWKDGFSPEIQAFFLMLKELFAAIEKFELAAEMYEDFAEYLSEIFEASYEDFLSGVPFTENIISILKIIFNKNES